MSDLLSLGLYSAHFRAGIGTGADESRTIAFSLVAEMSTRRLQIKTVALGRAAYNVAAIVVNVLTPYMINPTAWNWGNYAGFFWGATYVPPARDHEFDEVKRLTGQMFFMLRIPLLPTSGTFRTYVCRSESHLSCSH